ncbi:MAG: Nif11-like leader peptide family natural product precursor [Gammaproteobacteria bacterium]|nr:Nif11-like leader peptide family natural product precursor [Gammaproteobacteria bacterium]MDE0270898.1 Nif11-like leader peptide family natural product precursor [Gammaproteobacteria bacterium]
MSIENGERFIRALKADQGLRDKVRAEGRDDFTGISAEAGASCDAFDVVVALLRQIEGAETLPGWER